MRGRLRPVGGDWLLVRNDGVGVLDVRATMELDNGAIVYTTYGGLLDLGLNGHKLFLQGILPARVDLRIVPRYHTSHPDYLWLNRLQCVGVGVFDRDQLRVSYDIYALRKQSRPAQSNLKSYLWSELGRASPMSKRRAKSKSATRPINEFSERVRNLFRAQAARY
jgi:hypothetical protein